jgi:6-phosphogluconolactonase
MTRLTTVADAETAARRAADEIARAIDGARGQRGAAHVSLAGGSTPRRAYELLADLLDDWEGVELWYGDERCVAPDDPESNHHMVDASLLAPLRARGPMPPPLEHRIEGELGPDDAAQRYAAELRGRVPAGESGLPRLDLAVLGLGEDGHTASLFPGHPEVAREDEPVLPVYGAPKPPPERVTLSLGVLRAARGCLLLTPGASKADAVAAVLAGPDPHVPASLLSSGRLHVITDDAAAPRPVDR